MDNWSRKDIGICLFRSNSGIPEFENVFVQFGQFHTEANIFSSLGKVIEGSGGPYLLTEANVVAVDSMKWFLKGKMYNRCRRGHLLLASAFHGLHFKCIIDDISAESNILTELQD